jgi:hypothetical protein
MKFVSKFQLGLPLAWQGCVAPGRDIFVRVRPSISVWIIRRLNYLMVIFVVMSRAANRNTLACHAV